MNVPKRTSSAQEVNNMPLNQKGSILIQTDYHLFEQYNEFLRCNNRTSYCLIHA